MISLESEILRALEEGEFFPVFQPLVELRTGRLVGFEALARWRHMKLGDIMPDEFIPLLEKNGLVDQLSMLILERAFDSPALRDSELTLAINVSPLQLLRYRSSERLEALASKARFRLSRLVFEMTESALVDDLERAQMVACELKELNCRFALDDFGTGYSSLKHLQALPFDELKVDKSFIHHMTEKRESRKIVAAVLGLGQSLGLTTVGEGIETKEQADMLHSMGCDLGQGWLFAKPCPVDELSQMASKTWRGASIVLSTPQGADSITRPDVPAVDRLAQLGGIYDGVPVGLCFLDRSIRYVSLNKKLSEINGVPAADHLGRQVAEVIPHVFPLIEPYIRQALQGKAIHSVEVTKPPREGQPEPQTLLVSYQPARDEAGEIVGVCVAIMDVTENRRTEMALRETEAHYRHMLRLGPHVPWVLDAKGEVIEASPRWEEFTGQRKEEALGNGWLKMLHPDDVEPTRQAIGEMLRTGLPIDVEYRVCKPGEDWVWMRARGSPRFGETGQIIYVYGVVEPLHSRTQLNRELKAYETALRITLDALPRAIVLADAADGSIFMVNSEAKRIFGDALFPSQRIDGYATRLVLRPDGSRLRPEEHPLVRSTLRGESVEDEPLIYERLDGTRIPVCASSQPVYSETGQLIGGMLMLQCLDAVPCPAPDMLVRGA
jgi:PAS domain S-box-containing protein